MSSLEHDIAGCIQYLNVVRLEWAAQAAGYATRKPRVNEIEITAKSFFLDIYPTEGAASFLVGGSLACATAQIDDEAKRIRELFDGLNLRFELEIYEEGDVDRVRTLRDSTRPAGEYTAIFELGSAYAPDSPWGLDRFVLYDDGEFRYENQRRETISKVVTGRLDAEALDEIKRTLDASGFPDVPVHDIPPGAANMAISMSGTHVFFSMSEACNFQGYGTLVETLERWTASLRHSTGSEAIQLTLEKQIEEKEPS